MRIEFERTGGVAGMRVSATIDTDSLSEDQTKKLVELVEASDFFNVAVPSQRSAGGTDRFQYTISISAEGRERTIGVGEASSPESLRPLLQQLTTLARSGNR
jgi:hypothetical protein